MNLTINNYVSSTQTGLSGGTLNTGNTSAKGTGSFHTGKSKGKKMLHYNAKSLSAQILRATKSRTASTALVKAKNTVSNLKRCLETGEYDNSEVEVALAHAKKMVKCAQAKVTNLKQEEALQRKYSREKASKEQQQKSEVKRRVHQKEQNLKEKIASEELQQIQKEKKQKQEISRKRQMHRKAERNELGDADMKYLQDTLEYRHDSHVDCSSVSVDLSSVGMSMSELQQIEAQLSAEVETDAAAGTGTGTDVTSGTAGSGVGGAAMSGISAGGSV